MPQGSAYGTCAFGFDVLESGPGSADQRTATWDDLEREMADLVTDCVGDSDEGQGGNHTWRGFVLVLVNPTQVDTGHTCLSPPTQEEYMNLAQCMTYRSQVEAAVAVNAPPVASVAVINSDPGPGSSTQGHQAEVALNNMVVAGHKRGGAWVLWTNGEHSAGGYWTMLKGGIENLYVKGSRRRAYTYNGRGWSAWDGPRIPRSGAMIQVPENFLPLPQHVVVVWKADMWIPTLSSLQANADVWWIWVAGQWTPLSPELLSVVDWALEHGAWRVMAGSWFFSTSLRIDNAGDTSTSISTSTSTKSLSTKQLTTTDGRARFLEVEASQPSQTPPPTPPSSPDTSTGSKPGPNDEFMMPQGMAHFDLLTAEESDLAARVTKRPRVDLYK